MACKGCAGKAKQTHIWTVVYPDGKVEKFTSLSAARVASVKHKGRVISTSK